MNILSCPHCQQTEGVIKAGFNPGGSQRYRCKNCQCYFTPNPDPQGYEQALHQQALKLYLEGTSFRAIGRFLNINHQTVSNWLNASSKELPTQVTDHQATENVEIDELFTFIGDKKEVYLVVAVNRETRLIVGQAVVTHRTQAALQKLVDELPRAERYCTDGFTNYAELVWPQDSEHVISPLKEETYTIEGINADLRTYLGRLARRSRCFSRSLEALRTALRLFTWYYNRRQRLINANPKFKNQLCLVF